MAKRLRRRRKLVLATASMTAVGMLAGSARATQMLFEPFDYTVNDRLGGSGTSPLGQIAPNGEQWITRSPASGGTYNPVNDTLITSGNLSYLGLAPSSGSSVRYGSSVASGGAGKYADAIRLPGAASITTGSLYYSAIVRFNGTTGTDPAAAVAPGGTRHSYASFSTDTANPLTDAGFGVSTAGGGGGIPLPAAAWLRDSGTTDFHFGAGKQNSDGMGTSLSLPTWQSGAVTHANQQGNVAGTGQDEATIAADTWFVVLKYTFNADAASNDTVSLWVNPIASNLGTNPGEAAAGMAGGSYYSAINGNVTGNLDAAQIRSFMLLGLGQTVNVNKSIDTSLDELRIGDTWADVTPKAPLIFDGNAAAPNNPSDTSGAWEAIDNWWDGAAAVNRSWGVNDNATFGTGSGSGSVAVSIGSPQTGGRITFASGSPTYTLSGSAITLTGSDVIGITANQSGTISSEIILAGAQTWTVASGATLTAGNVSGSANLRKNGAGTAVVNHVRAGALSVSNGVLRIAPNSTAAGTSKVTTVAVTAARLDLSDNKLITSSPVGTFVAGAYTDVSGLVDSGRGNASNAQWDGNGIVTTDTRAVNNNDLTSIGVIDASDKFPGGETATAVFGGQTVLGSDTLVMFTWGGDANLDGKINIDDYGQIDFNVGSSGSVFGWYNGDFNYDGKINIDDYGIIDFNVTAQSGIFPTGAGGGLEGVAAVPEPASISLLGAAALGLLSRRRRVQ
ncbi:MAG: PEP-CTERM sorting domain-containing protein [Tepidisphaeraceae bacterium]